MEQEHTLTNLEGGPQFSMFAAVPHAIFEEEVKNEGENEEFKSNMDSLEHYVNNYSNLNYQIKSLHQTPVRLLDVEEEKKIE